MKQGWIFFDTDETLFTLDSSAGLWRMFLDYNVTFTAEDLQDYQTINEPLWMDYQNGTVTSLQLQHGWFKSWAERLKVGAGLFNDVFISAMTEIRMPLPGTISLLSATRGNAKIDIITNGLSTLQQVRLERTGLRDYFDLLVISEEIDVAKPNRKIPDCALEQMDNPDRSRVLMTGDTTEPGILNSINTGLATCWLNAHRRGQPGGIAPTWTVSSLHELEQLLCKH